MKPIYLTLISILLTLTSFTQTQPQFKFWLAFEDSIGAKDTLWVIIDTAAKSNNSLPPDTLLGEIPLGIVDSNKFLVYYKITDNDSFKINVTNTNFKEVSFDILAQNYHLPITIRWDSSLLRNNGLPWEIKTAFLYNTFTFFNPNIPGNDVWDLFITDTFCLPFDLKNTPLSYFLPIKFYLSDEESISISEREDSKKIIVYPNPSNNYIFIESPIGDAILKLFSIDGKFLKKERINTFSTLSVTNYPKGAYFIQIQNSQTNEIIPIFIN